MNRWTEYRAGTLTPPAVVQHDTDGPYHLIWVYTPSGIIGPFRRSTYDETSICNEAIEILTTAEEAANSEEVLS